LYCYVRIEDLHKWSVKHFDTHASFERVDEREQEADVCVQAMRVETEEGKKVERNGAQKFVGCFRRLKDPPWPDEDQEVPEVAKEST
jgi:tRNA (guanine-N7-)-methyltransferase